MALTLEDIQKIQAKREQDIHKQNLTHIESIKTQMENRPEEVEKDNIIHNAFNEALTGTDQDSAAIKLAEETGVDTSFATRNYEQLRSTWADAGFNAREWRRKNPDLASKILERPDLGKAFMRDQNLSLVTRALNKVADFNQWYHQVFNLDPNKVPILGAMMKDVEETGGTSLEEEFKKQGYKPQEEKDQDLLRPDKPQKMLVREDAFAQETRAKWYGPALVPFYRYSETALQQEIATDSFELMGRELFGFDSTELQKSILDKKQMSVPRDYQEGAVGQVFTDAAQGAAGTIKVLKDAGWAAGGAAAATYGGAKAISYFTKIPLPAGKLSGKAASIFFTGAQFYGSFKLETGAAYDDLRNATTESGEKVSKFEAAGGAIIYGSMAAGLEVASERVLLKALGPLGDAILKGEGKAAMRGLMKDAGFRQIAKIVGKQWLAAGGAEGGTGALQEAWQEATRYFTKSYAEGKFQSKSEIDPLQIAVAGEKEAVGGFALASVASSVNIATQMMARGRSIEAGRIVAQINKLKGSSAVRASPEAVADVIVATTLRTGTPVTHMYVDPGGLLHSLGGNSQLVEEAMVDLMGEDGPQKLRDAITSGSKLEVPLAQYLEKWGPKPIAEKIAEHTTTGSDLLTPYEMKEQEKAQAKLEEKQTEDAKKIYEKVLEDAKKETTDTEAAEATAAEATAQPSRQKLFRSPEEAGMDGPTWQKYLDDHAKSTSKAARYAALRKAKQVLKEKTKEWKTDTEAFRAEAEKEYTEHPAVKAKELLKTGKADEIASVTGYSTGQELLEAIKGVVDKKKWVATRVAEKMQAKHPDMIQTQSSLKNFIDEGFHGEFTLKWLKQELKALKQKVNPEEWNNFHEAMLDAPVDAIKRAALMEVEGKQLKDLHPGKILQRENRAADQAMQAVLAGNYLQAAVHTQRRIYNHLLFKQVVDAKNDKDSFLKLVGQLKKTDSVKKINKTSTVLGDGIYKLLHALEFIPKIPIDRERATLEQVAETIAQFGGTPFDPDTLQSLVADAIDRPQQVKYKTINGLPTPRYQLEPLWKRMSVNEMRHTLLALKNIRTVANNASTAIHGLKRVESDIAASFLVSEAKRNVKERPPVTSTTESEDVVERESGTFSGIDGSLTKPEMLAMRLGGEKVESWWYQLIVKPLMEAKRLEADIRRKALKPIMERFDAIPDSIKSTWRDSVNGKELFKTHTNKIMAPRMRFELIMLVLNSGNYSNLGRLVVGRGISVDEIQNVIDNVLTEAEMNWIQSVWDASERKFELNGVETSLWRLNSDLEERDSGIVPPKIEGREIIRKGKKYRGGYFPAVYDLRVSQPDSSKSPGQILPGQTIQGLLDNYYMRPGTPHGHMKRRAENFNGIISLSPSVIRAHFSQMVHDISHREAVKSVGGLLLRKDVDAAMKETLGYKVSRQMIQWVKDVGTQRGQDAFVHTEELNRWVRTRKKALSTALLGWRATLAATEAPKVALALRYVKADHWAAGLAEFARDRSAAIAFVQSKSGEMRSRMDQIAQEFDVQLRQLSQTGALSTGPLGWLRDHAFFFMETAFKVIATPVWLGAYRQKFIETQNEKLALDFADNVISKIFVSYATVDQAAILRDKTFWGISTMFYGEMNTGYNLLRETVQPLLQASNAKEFAAAMPKVTGQAMALFMFYNILPNLILGRGPPAGSDEDRLMRWAKWLGVQMAIAPLQFLPEVGNLAESVGNTALKAEKLDAKTIAKAFANPDFNIRSGPIATLGAAALQALSSTGKLATGSSKDPQEDLMNIGKGFGLWLGVPVFPFAGTLDYAVGLARGKEKPRNVLDVASGVFYGPPRKNEKLNPLTAISELISGPRPKLRKMKNRPQPGSSKKMKRPRI